VLRSVEPRAVTEGAGVRLRRSIALPTLDHLDPFLLLDHFSSDNPEDYLAGFPRHPHRGIETVTYLLAGAVRHGDSLGNRGTIEGGDVQWMTAGRGILHEEFPEPRDGRMDGFQLWVNLPARLKLCPPRYQDVKAAEIPTARTPEGASVRVVAGRVGEVVGPVSEIAARPIFLDVELPPGGRFEHAIEGGHAAFAYVFRGEASFGDGVAQDAPRLVVLGEEGPLEATAGTAGARFLLCAGQPLREPIARYGPFVMNTRAEIEQTLRELAEGTFAR
jgi:hypothetical protein